MKLSIVVPVYGVEKYIKDCISSLLVADCNDYEIIIVNDGTKDRSIDIVRENFNDPRIRIIEQENAGLSAARNHGIREAAGEYIWCFDSDDWAETSMLPELFAKLDGVDLVFLTSHYLNFEKTGEQKIAKKHSAARTGIDLAKGSYYHPAPFYVIRKTVLDEEPAHYFTEGILHEDSLFTPINVLRAKTVCCFDIPLYHYRQREGSITKVVKPKRLYDLKFVISSLVNYGNNNLSKGDRNAWEHCIAEVINELLYTAQECRDYEAVDATRNFVNNNIDLIRCLWHSGRNNKIMAVLAILFWGRLWTVYGILYKIRY